MKTKTVYLAVVISLMASAGVAQASYSWTMTGSSTTPNPLPFGNTRTFTGTDGDAATADPSVTASAWSNTGSNTTTISGTSRVQGPTTNSVNYTIESAYLPIYGGGLGVMNQDASSSSYYGDKNDSSTSSGEHSVDNNQRNDIVLFNFGGTKINLEQVILGWSQYCADITVLAYTSDTAFNTATKLAGLTYLDNTAPKTDLVNSGWEVVGHYANAAKGDTDIKVNLGTSISSSYWLIGAYNPSVGGTGLVSGCDGSPTTIVSNGGKCHGTFTTTSYNSANVKIAGLVGKTPGRDDTPGIPEPATLGLLGLGLLGLVRARKRVS